MHLTQIAGDKVQKVDLCEECAKHKGVNDPTGFSLADLLLGIGASQEFEQAAGGAEVKCPKCGFTQADFKKTGRLGCAECYHTFAEGLEPLLRTMHKGTRHIGKAPQVHKQSQDLTDRLRQLERKLEKAISDEDFEAAVHLRDDIKVVKGKLNELTPG